MEISYLPLINCEIELDLPWSNNCIISKISRTPEIAANPAANPPVLAGKGTLTTGVTFQINGTKLYVPVVILSINSDIKFLEHLKQ